MEYGLFMDSGWGYRDSAHSAAVNYIRDCLRPMNDADIYWTVTYPRNDPMRGLWELKLPTLHKIIGIMQKIAFSQKKTSTRHGGDRFIPDICSGNYKTKTQRKAVINSVYHFLYLIEDTKKVDVGVLHDMLRGLPCNRKNFVNCSLPVRREQVEALLKFMIASVEDPYRDEFPRQFPRAISYGHDNTIMINSEELVDLLWNRHEEADRIIEMFINEGSSVGLIKERLDTHVALDSGVL